MTILRLPTYAATHDFGSEWFNNAVIQLTQSLISVLRKTQTGQLNWNVAGIVMGLLMVLAVLLLKVGGTP